jgi:hypothetical protein
MRALIAAIAWIILTLSAAAQDCVVGYAMDYVDQGALYEVGDNVDRAYFYLSDAEQSGCPYERDCRRRAFVVGGDDVMVVAGDDEFSCALYVGGAPKFAVTAGWVRSELLEESRPRSFDREDFHGQWAHGEFHQIEIADATDEMVRVSGWAAYGAEDPERLARGAVNVGELSVFVPESDSELAFTIDRENVAQEYAYGDPNDGFCRVRMHRDGPYLVVTDNYRCGGMNVTFSGLYRRAN